jgi:hypothetical protein
MKKNNFIILSLIVILSCLSLINCKPKMAGMSQSQSQSETTTSDSPNSPNKILDVLISTKENIFNIFIGTENYLIKFHQFLLNDMNVEYPFDLVIFTIIGMLIFYVSSIFNMKREYVYNQPDQPDLNTLINNVKKNFK